MHKPPQRVLRKAACTDVQLHRAQDLLHHQASRTESTKAASATRTTTLQTITQTTVITETVTMTEAVPIATAVLLQEVQAAHRAATTTTVQEALHTEDKHRTTCKSYIQLKRI